VLGASSPMAGYVAAGALVAIALALCLALAPWLAPNFYMVMVAAVFLAAWFGGTGPGILAGMAGFLAIQLFLVEPAGPASLLDPGHLVRGGAFLALALTATLLSAEVRSAYGQAVATAQENALYADQLQEQAVELEHQTEEAQSLAEELEHQVEEATGLRTELEEVNSRLEATLAAERDAAAALRESETRFRTMADTAPVLVWMSDADGRFGYVNRPWLQFTGRNLDDEIGHGWTDGIHPDDRAGWTSEWSRTHAAPAPFRAEYRLRRSDGEHRWVLASGTPRFDAAGDFRGFIGSCIDIHERREEEEWLRFLSEAGATLSSSLDYEETLRRVCRLAVPALADYCVIDLVEDGELRRVEAAHADPALQEVMERLKRSPLPLDHPTHPAAVAVRTGESQSGDGAAEAFSDPRDPGAYRPLLEALRPRTYASIPIHVGADVLGAITFVSTTSGRRYEPVEVRRARELGARAGYAIENARLYARTAEANDAKSDFLAVMSHELRTPLNAILGYTDLFLTGIPEPLPLRVVPQVERVQDAARHLRDLIEEVLSFARLEAGHEQAQLEEEELGRLTRSAAALVEPLAERRGLSFRVRLPAEDVPIVTDARKLRQIVVNLAANAVKFTDAGEIEIEALSDGRFAVVAVRDTGPGIGEDDLERIFDPFWQADQRLAREHGGSGLGLSVARQLARLLGGDVSVRSRSGEGSEFTLRVPLGGASAG
jgi:PAS domain S-box-containing protein